MDHLIDNDGVQHIHQSYCAIDHYYTRTYQDKNSHTQIVLHDVNMKVGNLMVDHNEWNVHDDHNPDFVAVHERWKIQLIMQR